MARPRLRPGATGDLTPTGARLALLLIALALLLASLDDLRTGLPTGADLPSHLAEVTFLAERMRALDPHLWFDGANLGYPLFAAYQPLLTLLTALAVVASGLPADLVVSLALVLLWMLTPASWAWGGRALGLDRLSAVVLAVLALAARDLTGFGLGIAAVAEWGLFTQQGAMVALPLAVGALGAHLAAPDRREGRTRAALAVAVVTATHLFFGVLTGVTGLALVATRTGGRRSALGRLVVVGGLAALLLGPWLVPLVRHLPEVGGMPWPATLTAGIAPPALLRAVLDGALFDHGRRWPWLGTAVAIGAAGAVLRARTDAGARAVLAVLAVGVLGWLGPTTGGAAYDHVPLLRAVEPVRWVAAIHAAGVLLAAPVIAALIRGLARLLALSPGLAPRALGLATALVVGVLAADRARDLAQQVVTDVDPPSLHVLQAALARPTHGRLHGDVSLGSSSARLRNGLALRSGRAVLGSHSRGFHDTLGTYYALSFDRSAAQARLYHVTTLIAVGPDPPQPSAGWARAVTAGPYALWEATRPAGLFAFVRTPVTLGGPPQALRPALLAHAAALFAQGELPLLDPEAPPTADADAVLAARVRRASPTARGGLDGSATTTATRSRVLVEAHTPNVYAARVEAAGGDERLALAVSWDRGWRATVDGVEVPVLRLGPCFLGLDVPAGPHLVELRYQGPAERGPLAALAALVLLALGLGGRRGRRGVRSGGVRPLPDRSVHR